MPVLEPRRDGTMQLAHKERILIRGFNWLGDSVMSLPAIELLRNTHPQAHLTVLAPHRLADFWRRPLVDSVMTFDAKESYWQVAGRLRKESFTTAIVLPLSIRSGLEVALAGIPRRIGYEHRGRGLLLTHRVAKVTGITEMRKKPANEVMRLAAQNDIPDLKNEWAPSPQSHHLYRNLHLMSELIGKGSRVLPTAPSMSLTYREKDDVLREFGVRPDSVSSPLFGMCPGGEYGEAKRWPEERFVEAAKELHSKLNCRWVLFGSPSERDLCSRITDALNGESEEPIATNLAGRTRLHELFGALAGCSLVLTNDTGPMHAAAAVGTPVVGIFGSTSPELTGPGLPGDLTHRIIRASTPCSPCFLRTCPIDFQCMRSIEVSLVVNEILAMHLGDEAVVSAPAVQASAQAEHSVRE